MKTEFWLANDFRGVYGGPYYLEATQEEIVACFSWAEVLFKAPTIDNTLSQADIEHVWTTHLNHEAKRQAAAKERKRKMYEKLKKEFE